MVRAIWPRELKLAWSIPASAVIGVTAYVGPGAAAAAAAETPAHPTTSTPISNTRASLNFAPPTVTPCWLGSVAEELSLPTLASPSVSQTGPAHTAGGRIDGWGSLAGSRFGHQGSRMGLRWPRCSTRRRGR